MRHKVHDFASACGCGLGLPMSDGQNGKTLACWRKVRSRLLSGKLAEGVHPETNSLLAFPRGRRKIKAAPPKVQRKDASMLPPSTVTIAAVVLVASARATNSRATSSAVTSWPSRLPAM